MNDSNKVSLEKNTVPQPADEQAAETVNEQAAETVNEQAAKSMNGMMDDLMDSVQPDNSSDSDNTNNQNGFNTDFTQSDNNIHPDMMYSQHDANQPPRGSGLAIASLVLGGLSVTNSLCCTHISIICGIIAVVFGLIEIKNNKENNDSRTMAIIGLITGGVGALVGIGLIIYNIYQLFIFNEVFNELIEEGIESAVWFIG